MGERYLLSKGLVLSSLEDKKRCMPLNWLITYGGIRMHRI